MRFFIMPLLWLWLLFWILLFNALFIPAANSVDFVQGYLNIEYMATFKNNPDNIKNFLISNGYPPIVDNGVIVVDPDTIKEFRKCDLITAINGTKIKDEDTLFVAFNSLNSLEPNNITIKRVDNKGKWRIKTVRVIAPY